MLYRANRDGVFYYPVEEESNWHFYKARIKYTIGGLWACLRKTGRLESGSKS